MSKAKHTPGPWYWHFDGQARASLRTPDRGQLIVMDFVRQGMHSAAPRFAIWPEMEKGAAREKLGGVMKPLPQIVGSLLAGHPDARLIAAAPDLLAACEAVANNNGGPIDGIVGDRLKGEQEQWVEDSYVMVRREDFDALCAAIAKATGE